MQRGYDGVRFYGKRDGSLKYELQRALPILDEFDEHANYCDVNRILELYNIHRILGEGTILPAWNDEKVQKYRAIGKRIRAVVGRFFAKIDNETILHQMQVLDSLYIEEFFELFEKDKVYIRIYPDIFLGILNEGKIVLNYVLRHQNVVLHFGTQIAEYMVEHCESGKLLIDHYLSAPVWGEKDKLFFPGELSIAQRGKILAEYIESEDCNLNELRIVQEAQSTPELFISDTLQLRAKRRYNEECDKHFTEFPGIQMSTVVGFAPGMDEVKEEQFDQTDFTVRARYSSEWVRDNLDYPTLLNNLIYLFGYTDLSCRSIFPAVASQNGITDTLFSPHGVKDYPLNHSFHAMDMLTQLQMASYSLELRHYGIELENVFKWFFEQYLPDEFDGVKIRYNIATPGASVLEKNKMLATELDNVLRQYSLYCEHGEIDPELLEISSQQVVFSEIPSMQSRKYIYAKSNECHNIQYLLFSDQSPLPTPESADGEYLDFASAVARGLISIGQLHAYEKSIVEQLCQWGIIDIANDGILLINAQKAMVYKELYKNEVMCCHYYKKLMPILSEMENRGEIEYDATLFSRPEQHYLNYMLNQKEYGNGLRLRNKYVHGGYPIEEEKQERDHWQLLKIMALVIIKINEEFCLRLKKQESAKVLPA